MIIAVDFDGTICAPRTVGSEYKMGGPEPGAIVAIDRLISEGHTIVIFTARAVNNPNVYKAVEDWLKYFRIQHSGITNIKRPEFDVYIDNRCLHFNGSWTDALADIRRLQNDMQIKNYTPKAPNPLLDITKPLG